MLTISIEPPHLLTNSGPCIYKNCARKLCYFEHLGEQDEATILDVDEEGQGEYLEVNINQCHLCREQVSSQDDQIDHVRRDHTGWYQEMMDYMA
jgi:hypothetical protein